MLVTGTLPMFHKDISLTGTGLRPVLRRAESHNRLYKSVMEKYAQAAEEGFPDAEIKFMDPWRQGDREILGGVYALNIINQFLSNVSLNYINENIYKKLMQGFSEQMVSIALLRPFEASSLYKAREELTRKFELMSLLRHLSEDSEYRSQSLEETKEERKINRRMVTDISELLSTIISDERLFHKARETGLTEKIRRLLLNFGKEENKEESANATPENAKSLIFQEVRLPGARGDAAHIERAEEERKPLWKDEHPHEFIGTDESTAKETEDNDDSPFNTDSELAQVTADIAALMEAMEDEELENLSERGIIPISDREKLLTHMNSITDKSELIRFGIGILEAKKEELTEALKELYSFSAGKIGEYLYGSGPAHADRLVEAMYSDEKHIELSHELLKVMQVPLEESEHIKAMIKASADGEDKRKAAEKLMKLFSDEMKKPSGDAMSLVESPIAFSFIKDALDAVLDTNKGPGVTKDYGLDPEISEYVKLIYDAVTGIESDKKKLLSAENIPADTSPVPRELELKELKVSHIAERDSLRYEEKRLFEQAVKFVLEEMDALKKDLERPDRDMEDEAIKAYIDNFPKLSYTEPVRDIVRLIEEFSREIHDGQSKDLIKDAVLGELTEIEVSADMRLLDLTEILNDRRSTDSLRDMLSRRYDSVTERRYDKRSFEDEKTTVYRLLHRGREDMYEGIETVTEGLKLIRPGRSAEGLSEGNRERFMKDMEAQLESAERRSRTEMQGLRDELRDNFARETEKLYKDLKEQSKEIEQIKNENRYLESRTSKEVVTGYVFKELERRTAIERMRRGL